MSVFLALTSVVLIDCFRLFRRNVSELHYTNNFVIFHSFLLAFDTANGEYNVFLVGLVVLGTLELKVLMSD